MEVLPVYITYPNGDFLVGNTIEMAPIFTGHEIEMKTSNDQAYFEDGSKTRWFATSAFDGNGQLPFYMVTSGEKNGCHTTGNVREVAP
jgi:hypothetical protein